MAKVIQVIIKIVVGVFKGGGKATLIPTIIDEVKKFKKGKGLLQILDLNGDGKVDSADYQEFAKYLDVNGDDKHNLKDIQDLQWETLGKIVGLVGAACTLLYFISRFAPVLLTLI